MMEMAAVPHHNFLYNDRRDELDGRVAVTTRSKVLDDVDGCANMSRLEMYLPASHTGDQEPFLSVPPLHHSAHILCWRHNLMPSSGQTIFSALQNFLCGCDLSPTTNACTSSVTTIQLHPGFFVISLSSISLHLFPMTSHLPTIA